MDLGRECSILEVVEDNEEISNDSVPENVGNNNESKVQSDGSRVVENNDYNELYPDVKQNRADITCAKYSNSPPVDLKPEMSPSPTRKGRGLRKWRRIKRDTKKGGDSAIDIGKMMTRQLSNSDVSSSKRMQYAERKQKSEGSVSSTNAVVQKFDDLGFGLGGTDSENSEDCSSKSSTAASAPKIKYETPIFFGYPPDRSSNGKNLTQQVKGRVETNKKARGERIKIEKENSHSSLESDSRSSNFLFMQGTYSTKNGIRDESLKHYQGENGDEVQRTEQAIDEQRGFYDGDGEGGYGGGVADSSSEVKEERSENHGSSSDQDPLDESLFALQSVQEALEKEVLKFQEISVDTSDLGTEFMVDEQETSSKQLPDEGVHSFSRAVQPEIVETEVEDLFKQKIEAEVEHTAISRTVQNLRVAAVGQITLLEEQKALSLEQTQILDKLGVAESKAAVLEKEAEKLENICEVMKLQSRVCKYSSCFLLQLVLLLVILVVFMFDLSPSLDVVPT